MLMQLDLALIAEVVGTVGEEIEDTELTRIIS